MPANVRKVNESMLLFSTSLRARRITEVRSSSHCRAAGSELSRPRPLPGSFRAMACCLVSMLGLSTASTAAGPQETGGDQSGTELRLMALTVDDLPANCTCRDLESWRQLTEGLLEALAEHGAPAIGFVNEGKLYAEGASLPEPERVDLLRRWLDRGFELGNHTFSHPDLHRVPLAEFQADAERGERVTRRLLLEHGRSSALRFFRHPFLHTGRDLETKHAFESWLEERGQRVAPVTIDNAEWIYARAYDRALDRSGTDAEWLDTAARVRTAYLDYMLAQTAFFEQQSRKLLGREMVQVLLLHANRLNADALDELLRRHGQRGYRFVTLDAALEDPAYQLPDEYVGPAGMSWIQRWAWTRGHRGDFFAGEPEVETWVRDLADG